MKITWPPSVSALIIAMQTTCAVNGHRFIILVSSSRLASCSSPAGRLLAGRIRYSWEDSSNESSETAEVSMSKTRVAMGGMMQNPGPKKKDGGPAQGGTSKPNVNH